MVEVVRDIVDLATGLAARGESIYLGRSHDGRLVHAGVRDSALAIGPPGSGKTSAVFAPSVAGHPGPVVFTASRGAGRDPDIRRVVGPSRTAIAAAFGGEVLDFSLDDTYGFVYPETWWDIGSGCETWRAADRRANALAEAGIFETTENHEHWRNRVSLLLGPLLLACHLYEPRLRGIDLLRILQRMEAGVKDEDLPSLHKVASVLEDRFPGHDAVMQLRLFTSPTAHGDARADTFQMTEGVLRALRRPHEVLPAELDLDAFVRSYGTLFIVVGDAVARDARPLVATLLGAIEEAWNRCPPEERAPSMLFALDEVASVAPLPSLPRSVGTAGGSGIQLLLGTQHSSFLAADDGPWGARGAGILGAVNHLVIFPGLDDPSLLKQYEAMLPKVAKKHVDVNIAPGFVRTTGGPDAKRLIQERTMIELHLADQPHIRRRVELLRLGGILQRDRLRDGIRCREGSSVDALMNEVMGSTIVGQVSTLRSEHEAADIFKGTEGMTFVRSGNTTRYLRATPAHQDALWRSLLGPGVDRD